MSTADRIRARLSSHLAAERVEVEDESAQHAGHAGARGGGGHFRVLVVAGRFAGLDRVARQRAVHDVIGDMIPGEIHALSSRTLTPEEWRAARERAE